MLSGATGWWLSTHRPLVAEGPTATVSPEGPKPDPRSSHVRNLKALHFCATESLNPRLGLSCDILCRVEAHTPWEQAGIGRRAVSHPATPARNCGGGDRGPRGRRGSDGSHLLNLFLHHLDLILSWFYLLLQLLDFVVEYKLEFLQFLVFLFQIIDALLLQVR